MNPFFQIIVGMLFHAKRTCPHCMREQIVRPARTGKVIRCKFCGKPMSTVGGTGTSGK
jgi:ribosomal protein S27E